MRRPLSTVRIAEVSASWVGSRDRNEEFSRTAQRYTRRSRLASTSNICNIVGRRRSTYSTGTNDKPNSIAGNQKA